MALVWTAWNNGRQLSSGAGYGLKVPIGDRDRHFKRQWATVLVEFPRPGGFAAAECNTGKESFWTETCHELISRDIGKWLRGKRLAPWPSRQPPKLRIEIVGERRFRVMGVVGDR